MSGYRRDTTLSCPVIGEKKRTRYIVSLQSPLSRIAWERGN